MVKIGLQINARFENIERLETCGEEFRWFMKMRCNACGEESKKWQYVRLDESQPTKGGRGSASLVEKCKLCSRENHLDIIKEKIQPYTADDEGKYKTVIVFDCRGIEPVKFDFRDGWIAKSSKSNQQFEVDLTDKEWYEVDENTNESVEITEVDYKFLKIKEK